MTPQEEAIMRYHLGGKVALGLPNPVKTVDDLCLAYTPGVGFAVKQLAEDSARAFDYTAKGNLVAVVSDGTAILGLGDLGPTASIPVMEGKSVLFKSFAGVNSWPVVLDKCRVGGASTGRTDPQRVIDAVMAIAPMYGGINLEDIAAPACFEIEDTLDAALDIPVFHDDQWGTAVITTAGVINYAHLCNRSLADLCVVINGAGAAGIRIADMCKAAGVKHLTMCDTKGAITTDRTDLNDHKRRHAVAPDPAVKTLTDALRGAHVFIGVSVANCVSGDDIRAMADYPAIFAMSNPDPEIRPEAVAEALAGKPYVMATGRSDFVNQVNNVLCFPFLFRGALDVRARSITQNMKVAAANALAGAARRPVTDDVKALYPNETLEFGPNYIIPKPFDRDIFVDVSHAVAESAIRDGVARVENFDLAAYKAHLEAVRAM